MINVVTALACEANPIIQHFRLKKLKQPHAFPIYDNGHVNLIISGIGKSSAACAVGYLQSLINAPTPHVWINVGIAGHKSFELGTGLLAHRVIDASSWQRYYPGLTFQLPCDTVDVMSVAQAEMNYAQNCAYDMEAAGFYAAASRFSSCELIHVCKVISDNQHTSSQLVNKRLGEELIGNHLLLIQDVFHELAEIQKIVHDVYTLPDEYEELLATLRFSVSQQNQLKQLVRRWNVLMEQTLQDKLDLWQFDNARQVLAAMESELNSKTLDL